MDYETHDGSHFSLREVWRNRQGALEGPEQFVYTTISATVDGQAYFGRLEQPAADVDESDVLAALQAVPPSAIYPAFEEGMTGAPPFNVSKHYLKAPSFTWDDCQPGVTFVADCMRTEIEVLERLRGYKHPNIVAYHGCVVKDGFVTHICLERCQSCLLDHIATSDAVPDPRALYQDVKSGVDFLHALGIAHNDINSDNVCIAHGRAVVVDFDSCLPFGRKLLKGVSTTQADDGMPLSDQENDILGLEYLQEELEKWVQKSRSRASLSD